MDSNSVPHPVVKAGKPSRLPAGSTLEISPGIHVPHPHAEVNLPGAGDPRLGDTNAVTEFVRVEQTSVDKSDEDNKKIVPIASVEQKPLPDEVKPKVVTMANVTQKIADVPQPHPAGTAAPAETHLAVEAENLNKTA